MEPAVDGLWQGNSHYEGVTNSQENGRDPFGLGTGRRNAEIEFPGDWAAAPPLCCPAPRLGEKPTAPEQEGSEKHCDPLLLNESHFLSPPCLELSFQMENPGDQTAGRHGAGVASR